jgi:DNA-directed RNA polymerase beta' subunit
MSKPHFIFNIINQFMSEPPSKFLFSPYNGDFDGDEMNISVPQSLSTHIESPEIASAELNIFKESVVLYDQEKYKEAFDKFKQIPNNKEAASYMADMHILGEGVEEDRIKAIEIYHNAGMHSHVLNQVTIYFEIDEFAFENGIDSIPKELQLIIHDMNLDGSNTFNKFFSYLDNTIIGIPKYLCIIQKLLDKIKSLMFNKSDGDGHSYKTWTQKKLTAHHKNNSKSHEVTKQLFEHIPKKTYTYGKYECHTENNYYNCTLNNQIENINLADRIIHHYDEGNLQKMMDLLELYMITEDVVDCSAENDKINKLILSLDFDDVYYGEYQLEIPFYIRVIKKLLITNQQIEKGEIILYIEI